MAYSKTQQRVAGTLLNVQESVRDPKTDISISIYWKYPYLIGLHYKGVFWVLIFHSLDGSFSCFFVHCVPEAVHPESSPRPT